jgi:hypothetical protein
MSKINLARLTSGLLILSIAAVGDLAMAYEPASGSGGRQDNAQACSESWAAAPLVAIANEPPPRLVADAPIPSQLTEGRVVIRYCAQNLRILPVFGEAALDVSPRIGHLHIRVDDGPYRWVDTSAQPIIVNKLPPGPHKILIELVDPTHRTLDRQVVNFTIPQPSSPR